MRRCKRVWGLIFLSMGIGMLIVIILPWWSFLIAIALIIYGLWELALRR